MGYKVKKIYIYQNGQEKQVRPSGWTPDANTLLYVPGESDLLDHSGNNIGITFSGTATYQNPGVLVSNGIVITSINTNYTNFTMCGFYKTANTTDGRVLFQKFPNSSQSGYAGWDLRFNQNSGSNNIRVQVLGPNYDRKWFQTYTGMTVTDWNFYCLTISNNIAYLYVNKTLKGSQNVSGYTPGLNYLQIGGDLYLGDVVFETKAWSDTERESFFDLNKSKYGIS